MEIEIWILGLPLLPMIEIWNTLCWVIEENRPGFYTQKSKKQVARGEKAHERFLPQDPSEKSLKKQNKTQHMVDVLQGRPYENFLFSGDENFLPQNTRTSHNLHS
jgi:hypothetical protein